jgi:predicted nucleic acid-binding protein
MTKRAVLDSSALVSAFITPKGPAGQLIHAAHRGAFQLCLSAEIIEETAGVLVRPKITDRYRRKPRAAQEFCSGLAAAAQLVTDLPGRVLAVSRDPEMPCLLVVTKLPIECVLQRAPQTGDDRLQGVRHTGGRIVTPERIGEIVNRDRSARAQGEPGKQDTRLAATDLDRSAVSGPHLQGTQNSDTHRSSFPRRADIVPRPQG